MEKISKNKVWPARIFLIAGILLIPAVLTAGTLFFLAKQKGIKPYLEQYRLPENFTESDFEELIGRLGSDQEYRFYFNMFEDADLKAITDDIYQVLDSHRSSGDHLAAIKSQAIKVESLAAYFSTLDYPNDFYKTPEKYPVLYKTFWAFIYNDFKATVLGITYKATYDQDFYFYWNQLTKSAASKFYQMVELHDRLQSDRLQWIEIEEEAPAPAAE